MLNTLLILLRFSPYILIFFAGFYLKGCMTDKLTKGVASGMSLAYNAENMKPETIQKRASELIGKGEIAGRVRDLQEKGAKIAVYTLTEHLSRL